MLRPFRSCPTCAHTVNNQHNNTQQHTHTHAHSTHLSRSPSGETDTNRLCGLPVRECLRKYAPALSLTISAASSLASSTNFFCSSACNNKNQVQPKTDETIYRRRRRRSHWAWLAWCFLMLTNFALLWFLGCELPR